MKKVKKSLSVKDSKQLDIAIEKNDIVAAKKLLQNKENLGSYLIKACRHGHWQIAKAIVETGTDVNYKNQYGETPLLVACNAYKTRSIFKIVKMLLEQEADTELYKKDEDGPLHYAAMFGHTKAVALLLEHGAKVNSKGAYKRTPLIYAASSACSLEIVKLLLDAGANIKAKNEAGENVLFELITHDKSNAQIARFLIDKGISPNCKCKHFGSALSWAAFCGRKNIVEVLLEKGVKVNEKGEPPIVKAMSQGHMNIVKLLFDHGADPASQGIFGHSLLEFAVEKKDQKLVKKIIAKSSKIEDSGALAKAAGNGDLAMVKLLVKLGLSIEECSSSETPLMKAAYHGRTRVLSFLLEKGANIQARDHRGNTALLHAAWAGHLNVVKKLLKQGANINEKNDLNWNALMQSCVEGHYATAKYLLDQGSATDEIDKEKGATALSLAKYAKVEKLVKLLISKGAKERNIKTKKKGEGYFSIIDCDICAYLPHKKDLGYAEYPETIKGLEIIFTEFSHPDRYTDNTEIIAKCSNCGTFYHHDHSIDTEDAFIGGPSVDQNFQRYNLVQLKEVLKNIGKNKELKELEARYKALVENCIDLIKKKPEAIKANMEPYIIETLTDYFVLNNNWMELKKTLLSNSNPMLALKTAYDMLQVYGGIFRCKKFPSFTYYRQFTKEVQKGVKAMIKQHKSAFTKCIIKFQNSKDTEVKWMYDKAMDSALYYKVIAKKKNS